MSKPLIDTWMDCTARPRAGLDLAGFVLLSSSTYKSSPFCSVQVHVSVFDERHFDHCWFYQWYTPTALMKEAILYTLFYLVHTRYTVQLWTSLCPTKLSKLPLSSSKYCTVVFKSFIEQATPNSDTPLLVCRSVIWIVSLWLWCSECTFESSRDNHIHGTSLHLLSSYYM